MRSRAVYAPWIAIALVVAATSYTALMCFLNTHVLSVSNGLVAMIDGAIVVLALILALGSASRWLWMLLLAMAVNFLVLTLLTGELNAKAVRDVLALVVFTALGVRFGTFERVRILFFIIAGMVLAVGVFEFAAPKAFTQVFNVIHFYAARGVVNPDAIQQLDSAFFLNGARNGERMLLPLLGEHRVSSIFLEPVSMGNFGALAMAFALSLDRAHWRTAAAAAAIGAVTIVLADARFASAATALFVVARLAPSGSRAVIVALLPLLALAVLIGFALSGVGSGDDMPTRLAGSGRLLMEMSPAQVFGIDPLDRTTFDAGYAYLLNGVGLVFCILLWAAYANLPAPTPQAQRYKLLLAVYICALLCISGTSLFALKTAAFALFTYGALAAPAFAARQVQRTAAAAPLAAAT